MNDRNDKTLLPAVEARQNNFPTSGHGSKMFLPRPSTSMAHSTPPEAFNYFQPGIEATPRQPQCTAGVMSVTIRVINARVPTAGCLSRHRWTQRVDMQRRLELVMDGGTRRRVKEEEEAIIPATSYNDSYNTDVCTW